MRTLVGSGTYEWPAGPWLRANMVSSVDGAAQGADGKSGSVNNAVDRDVFHQLRSGADAIVVGAGTARIEGYRTAVKPLVVVGHELPAQLRGKSDVRLIPGGDAAALRSQIGDLRSEGLAHILCEGGPSLLGDLIRADLLDELCTTITPRVLAGNGRRIVGGLDVDVPLSLASLVEQEGTIAPVFFSSSIRLRSAAICLRRPASARSTLAAYCRSSTRSSSCPFVTTAPFSAPSHVTRPLCSAATFTTLSASTRAEYTATSGRSVATATTVRTLIGAGGGVTRSSARFGARISARAHEDHQQNDQENPECPVPRRQHSITLFLAVRRLPRLRRQISTLGGDLSPEPGKPADGKE